MSDREKGGTVDIVHGRKNDDGTETLTHANWLEGECGGPELKNFRCTTDPLTDKQKLEDLLTSFGVDFNLTNDLVQCLLGGKKTAGIGWHSIDFSFTQDGEFIDIGSYE